VYGRRFAGRAGLVTMLCAAGTLGRRFVWDPGAHTAVCEVPAPRASFGPMAGIASAHHGRGPDMVGVSVVIGGGPACVVRAGLVNVNISRQNFRAKKLSRKKRDAV